ncbi:hypothetical protein OROMI_033563 [Orobanche minor]
MKGGFSYEEAADRCCPLLSGDLIMEILERLPVKSLLRFKSVSKAWQQLILNPQFIAKHLILQKKKADVNYLHCYHHVPHCRNDIFTRYPADHNKIGISLISKENNHNQNSLFSTRVLPLFYHDREEVSIVGSYNGLVCIRFSKKRGDGIPPSFGLWNPATRRFKVLPSPKLIYEPFSVGFSYVPSTGCYKLVIVLVFRIDMQGDNNGRYITRVQVLDVGHDRWREVLRQGQDELSHGKPFNIFDSPVVVNGCLYWLGSTIGDEGSSRSMVWFDIEKEVFFRQTLLSYPFDDGFNFFNTRCKLDIFEENLAMFVCPGSDSDSDELIYDEEEESRALQVSSQVWIYEEANRTWKKFFTFGPLPSAHLPPCGFWGNREIIIRPNEIVYYNSITDEVAHAYGLHAYLYNPDSKERTNSFCRERRCNLDFYPYVESLVRI